MKITTLLEVVMSFMFEVHYRAPRDLDKESRVIAIVNQYGGRPDFREEPDPTDLRQAVVLTFEFPNSNSAEVAAEHLRTLGESVDGPMDYGDR